MKIILSFVLVALLLPCFLSAQEKKIMIDNQLYLLCEENRLSIAIDMPWESTNRIYLSRLKAEVQHFMKTDTIPLKGGYSIIYMGGYPIWGPYQSLGPGYIRACLFFSEDFLILGKKIYFWGKEEKGNYYPYHLLQ